MTLQLLIGPAVDVFTQMFANGQRFCKPIPHVAFEHIELLWTEQNENAIASFKIRGKPATTSPRMISKASQTLETCLAAAFFGRLEKDVQDN
jgi:hypothetical protein